MTPRDISEVSEKDRALALYVLAEGSLTVSEVAFVLGQSRQIVQHWAKREGIDPIEARKDYVRRLWFARQKRRRR